MSTYYTPPPQRATGASSNVLGMNDEDHITLTDMQHSIYVFPNPASAPPSPGGSFVSSIPSDYSGTLPGSSRFGSREHSLSLSSTNSRPRTRTRRSSSAVLIPSRRFSGGISPAGNTSEGGTDMEVEVWDWMADSEGSSLENVTWELEAEVERVGRWGLPPHSRDEPWQTIPRGSSHSMPQPLTVTIPYRMHPLHTSDTRARTQSSTSAASSVASVFSSFRLSAIQSPQPRVHIPLLSFIASLFSLDLDDPALRLLTNSNSTSESVLFPGHSSLLDTQLDLDEPSSSSSGQDPDSESVDHESTHSHQPHGFLRLLVLSDETRISIRALKDGLAVSCSNVRTPSPSPFSLPTLGGVYGLCRLIGDACWKGGKAWRTSKSS
ncbi:hypothetical protein BXZ70DRAFT_615714 [Cristinia sonorae]|uniref:Uncharacterized protein n=1 Tax=Cristinia sonorae TaxID=1940300 RepID=A0A8K0XT51_9AGAR|nr:hypothetical protein BXZ70DRAFT_615714 [Cristinia sonorae]